MAAQAVVSNLMAMWCWLEVAGTSGGGHLLLIKLSIPMTTVRLAQGGGPGQLGH